MPGFTVSFRVTGRDVDPLEVSEFLGLQASLSHKCGDPHFGKQGRYADFPEGLWSLSSPLGRDRPLVEHIQNLRAQLEGKEQALESLRSRGYYLEIFVGVFDIGDADEISLSLSELKALSDLHVDVCFDLYTWNDPGPLGDGTSNDE